jgi:uncharacterized protein (TIGR03083 family)
MGRTVATISVVDHWSVIATHRIELADRLGDLTPAQWATPSLCSAWDVHHVVAHLVYPHKTGMRRFVETFARAWGSFDRANEVLTAREAARPSEDLVADLRRFARSRFRPPGLGPEAPLTDVMVHASDIGIPLGWPAFGTGEAWTGVLGFIVTRRARVGFVPRSLSGLRLVATDVAWEHGEGPEVSGPAVALALAALGRPALATELEGPGLSRLVDLPAN